MSDGETKRRLSDLEARAQTGRDGKPLNGEAHGKGRVVRVKSRGAGQPVVIRNPIGSRVGRVSGWTSDDAAGIDLSRSDHRTLTITPEKAQEGQEFILIVE